MLAERIYRNYFMSERGASPQKSAYFTKIRPRLTLETVISKFEIKPQASSANQNFLSLRTSSLPFANLAGSCAATTEESPSLPKKASTVQLRIFKALAAESVRSPQNLLSTETAIVETPVFVHRQS